MARSVIKAKMTKKMEAKHVGLEPEDGSVVEDIIGAYRAYNYFNGRREALGFLENWFKVNRKDVVFSRLNKDHLSSTAGWIADMISRNVVVPETTLKWFESQIDMYVSNQDEACEDISETVKPTSFKDKVHLADVDDEIDKFFVNFESEFSMKDYISSNECSRPQVSEIAGLVQRLKDEVESSKTDTDAKEAYAFMKPRQKSRYLKFLDSILADCGAFAENKRRQRKPRAKKKPSTEKILAHMKILEHSEEYNISSLPADTILTSSTLVVFNTKDRTLVVYESGSGEPLGVHRTSVTGYSEEKSFRKRIRKPNEVLPLIMAATKTKINKIFKSVKATEYKAHTGRLSEHTIILKGYK